MRQSPSIAPRDDPASKGLIAWFARNPVAAHALMGLLLIAGLLAAFNTPNVYFPTIEQREVSISVSHPGASVAQVDAEIVRRIESAIGGLDGVERVVGVATPELGVVTLEARNFADPHQIRREADNAIEALEDFPPPNAHQPEVVLRASLNRVATLMVYSSSAGEEELRLAAERLRDGLLAIPEVLSVDLEGVSDRGIAVEIAPEQLLRHGLTLDRAASAVSQALGNTAVGELRTAAGVFDVESDRRRGFGAELLDIVLIEGIDDADITVGDVAEVRDGFVEDRVSTSYRNSNAALLHVTVHNSVSVDDTSAAIGELLASFALPEGMHARMWENTAEQLANALAGLLSAILMGFAVAWCFLLLVFDLRIAFWAAVSIPLCIIGSLALSALVGLEFSVFSYISFFIFIGIVVDDTVVVAEGVASARSGGLRGASAAIAGARSVARPVTLGVATTMMALVPFLFITEPAFQNFITVAVVGFSVLAVSLVEAFLILPGHLAGDRPWSRPPLTDIQRAVGRSLSGMRDGAVACVDWSIRHGRAAAVLALLLAAGIFALLRGEAARFALGEGASVQFDYVQLELELPIGSPRAATAAVAGRYAKVAAGINEAMPDEDPVVAITTIVGQSLPYMPGVDSEKDSHLAVVRADLEPGRIASATQVADVWRQLAGTMPEVERAYFHAAGPLRADTDFEYNLLHRDPQALREAVRRARAFLEATAGTSLVTDTMRPGARKLDIELTPEGRAAGLTEVVVAKALRARLHGLEADRFQRGRDELTIEARYPQQSRAALADLANELLPVPGGGFMRLSTAANLVETRAEHELMRIDGKPAATISARTVPGVITRQELEDAFSNGLAPSLRNEFPGLEIEAAGFGRAAMRTAQLVGTIFAVTLLAMYVLLAAFQRSYWKPLLTLAGVPVCAAGALLLHVLLRWSPNVVSLMGIVAVSGIVINDGIVLLDRYTILRGERPDLPVAEIAKLATKSRFRAVLMTSVTTIAALSPILYSSINVLVLFKPFGIAMIGGSVFAALFVLFVMPVATAAAEGLWEV